MRLLAALATALAVFAASPALAQDPIAQSIELIAKYDNDEAKAVLDGACKSGNSEACWRLALLHLSDYSDEGKAAADKQFIANCAKGDSRSCYMIARRVDYSEDPKEIARVKARTRTALGKACNGGLAYACIELAQELAYDDSGKTDQKLLGSLYEKACAAGSREGCHSAAQLYGQEYENPLLDFARAATFELKACELGHAEACGDLPARESSATPSDEGSTPEQLRRWQGFREKACTLGDSDSCQEFLTNQLYVN
jgi:TPR repeat protein